MVVVALISSWSGKLHAITARKRALKYKKRRTKQVLKDLYRLIDLYSYNGDFGVQKTYEQLKPGTYSRHIQRILQSPSEQELRAAQKQLFRKGYEVEVKTIGTPKTGKLPEPDKVQVTIRW